MKHFALYALALFLLLSWQLTYAYTCFALLLLAACVFIITYSLASYTLQRRRCFANCFFDKRSLVFGLLNAKGIVVVMAFIVSLIVSLFLFSSVVRWGVDMWVIIIGDILLLGLIYKTLSHTLSSSLKAGMGKHLLKSWSVQINTVALTLFMLLYSYETLKAPDYISPSLSETLQASSQHYRSECELIDSVVQISTLKEASIWYVTLYVNAKLQNQEGRWLLWILFLIHGSIVYYGLSRFFIELITFESREVNAKKISE